MVARIQKTMKFQKFYIVQETTVFTFSTETVPRKLMSPLKNVLKNCAKIEILLEKFKRVVKVALITSNLKVNDDRYALG